MTIRELRILPPLAIARLGAAPTPMDNYDVEVDPQRPLGNRRLVPATTFEVDPDSGAIVRAFVPDELRFSQDGAVRPVAPFLEVWALTTDGALQPLTTELLSRCDASPADVRWRVHLANHKLYRRTGARRDSMAPSIVDPVALENLHQNLLVALRSGTAPWFADVLRDYDEIGDLSATGRRKMPGMMRGSDGRYLTLTRRQVSIIRAVARRAVSPHGDAPKTSEP